MHSDLNSIKQQQFNSIIMVNLLRFNRDSISTLNSSDSLEFYDVLCKLNSSYTLSFANYSFGIILDSPDLTIVDNICYFDSSPSLHTISFSVPLEEFVTLLLHKSVLYNDFLINLTFND